MFECRVRKNKLPKEGEVVIGKISSVKDGVVTIELLEYGNAPGLILSGELSKRRFKSISQVAKVGNVEVCQVLKVEDDKGFIDLSLKRVSDKEKQECRDEFSKTKLAYQIIAKACKLSGQSIKDTYESWAYEKEEEYGTLFSYFAHIKNNMVELDTEPNGKYFKKVIEEQFIASTFKVRADVEVTCAKGGIQGIKEAFDEAGREDSDLEMVLLKSPIYSITKIDSNKDEAFKAVETACITVKEKIESIGGTFNMINPAKLYGEKSKHSMLEESVEELEDSSK